jgi:hypothetical protein
LESIDRVTIHNDIMIYSERRPWTDPGHGTVELALILHDDSILACPIVLPSKAIDAIRFKPYDSSNPTSFENGHTFVLEH